MKVIDFYENVQKADDIIGVGVDGECAFVEELHTGNVFRISAQAIQDNTWEDIADVIRGIKEANTLYHFSRVVGYFSRLDNWNKSKIGELKDRHRGDYEIK